MLFFRCRILNLQEILIYTTFIRLTFIPIFYSCFISPDLIYHNFRICHYHKIDLLIFGRLIQIHRPFAFVFGQVQRLVEVNYPDPADLEKAKKLLKVRTMPSEYLC